MTIQIFKDATLYFSRSTPTLATVIPAMDHIDETLTSQSLDSDYEPAIRTALGLAKKVLFCHGQFRSLPYRLHPRHKLKYFKTAGWGG